MSRLLLSLCHLEFKVFAACFALLGASFSASADTPELSLSAQVGKRMFFDKSLSASGKMACSTCHDPDFAYGPPNGRAVQLGGRDLSISGTRAVPSLRYKDYTPPYADLFDNPDGVSAPGPGGGFTQDGHAQTLAEQAKIPLLASHEMANRNAADVVRKLQHSSYVDLFKQAFGDDVFNDGKRAFALAMQALEAFQIEDVSFHPYSSKYDLYAANKIGGTLTAAEARGLTVFSDENKGNCFACHYSGAGVNGSVAIFTDFSYSAIGVPRNAGEISASRLRQSLHSSYDMGICSRDDHPLPAGAQYCGMFKTPTLRNVATRKVFFHNGKIKSLNEALRFYNTRDTAPELWYPKVNGVLHKFDDLPAKYRSNIDTQMPLDGRARGSKPPMSDQDIADLEAFLGTLTDGYVPPGK